MIFLMMIDTPEEKRKFVIMYEKHRYLMQKVAMDILNDRYLAEDAVQNAFFNLAKNMEHIADPDGIPAKRYLIAITKNAAIDLYRKRTSERKKEVFFDELGKEDMPVTYLETDVENEVLDVLKNLPPKYRDIFLLKYSANMENAEIAKVCGLKEGTVRQRIARGKVLIEEELKKLEKM